MLRKLPGTAVIFLMLCWATGLAVFYYSLITFMADQPAGTDFYKFQLSAKSLLNHESPYWPAPQRDNPDSHCYRPSGTLSQSAPSISPSIHPGHQECLHPNLNPPAFVALTTPFGWFDFIPGYWGWSLLALLGGTCGAFILIQEHTRTFRWRASALGALLMLSWYPVVINIEYGQVGLWLFLLLTLAWRDLRHGRDLRAGLILGVAASLKLFVGLFIFSLLINRRWKACFTFAATCVAMALLGLAAVGTKSYWEYASALREVTWYASNWNASLAGLFYRIFGGASTPGFFSIPHLAAILTNLSAVLVLTATLIAINCIGNPNRSLLPSGKSQHRTSSVGIFAITPPAMLLLSPLGWVYYFPVLIITLSICYRYTKKSSLQNVFAFIFFIILTTLPFTFRSTERFSTPLDWWWVGAIYSYALVTLFFLALLAIRKIKTSHIITARINAA